MPQSKRNLKVLGRFKSLGEEVILLAPRRFFVFGEGKDGVHRGLVAEGSLPDRFVESGVYKISADGLEPIQARYDFRRKVQFFDELYVGATRVAQFTFTADQLKVLISSAKGSGGTHARVYRRNGESIKVRSFDARKYFDQLIAEHSPSHLINEFELQGSSTADFFVYLKIASPKQIPIEDYSVTSFSNGLLEFAGTQTDIVCHMRDQRLGQAFEQTLEQLNSLGTSLSFDPKRAQEVRRKMSALG